MCTHLNRFLCSTDQRRKNNAQVGAAVHKGWESGEASCQWGETPWLDKSLISFNTMSTLCFYNNDLVLRPTIDRGVDATVDDSCEDSNKHQPVETVKICLRLETIDLYLYYKCKHVVVF